jgi:hypothetical protein
MLAHSNVARTSTTFINIPHVFHYCSDVVWFHPSWPCIICISIWKHMPSGVVIPPGWDLSARRVATTWPAKSHISLQPPKAGGKCVANAWQMRGKWHEALVIFQGVIGFRDGLTTAADKHHSNILPIVAFGLLTCSHPCAPSHVGSCKVQMPCIRRQGVCIHGQFRSQFPLPPDGQAKKFCQWADGFCGKNECVPAMISDFFSICA